MRRISDIFQLYPLLSLAAFSLLLFSISPALAAQTEEDSYSHITAVLGHKTFEADYWEPAYDHGGFSIEYDFAKDNWPAGLMIGFSYTGYSSDDTEDTERNQWGPEGTTIKTSSAELYGGARKYFRLDKRFVPYIGAGLAIISMDITVDSGSGDQSESDIKLGAYFEVGLSIRCGSISIGLINRPTTAGSMSYFGREGDFRFFQDGFLVRFDLANLDEL